VYHFFLPFFNLRYAIPAKSKHQLGK